MSEESATPESAAPDTSGLATDLAMEEARNDPSLRAAAAAFLANQNSLVDLQKHHLQAQLAPTLWEKWLGVALRMATAIVGLIIAGGLAVMVWDAANSSRLVIEPFAVPPDLAARGLTGEVVAARLLDRYNAMQRQTASSRPPRVTTSDWTEHGIKLEIPESGISLAELDNWLRRKLGHDIHVSGEIVHTDTGLSLTVREGDEGTQTAEGTPAQLDALMQRLSEGLYETVQPYRYGSYLTGQGRSDDAIALLTRLAGNNDEEDKLWGYSSAVGSLVAIHRNLDAGIAVLQDAAAGSPTYNTWQNLALFQSFRSRPEEALAAFRKAAALSAAQTPALVAGDMGAFRDALPFWRKFAQTPHYGWRDQDVAYYTAASLSGLHEITAARSLISRLGGTAIPITRVLIAGQAQDWPEVLVQGDLTAASDYRSWAPTTTAPHMALAEARLGRIAAAERRIAATPADCYLCLRMRARIAEAKGDHARADWWFARAVRYGPSVPFANEDWGRALLARGRPDDAIAQFTLSNKRGPHFADPLEGWGEALMAKSQSHLALAKFAEAEKYAPNWGRLHMKWGEALVYAGKKDEAKAHFARAAILDLTPSEKAELAKVPHG